MTKEEIIDNIARLNSETWRGREEVRTEIGKLLSELKKALEQPTSDDCVSRAEMLKYQQYLRGKMSNEENHKLWEFIKALPPVKPTFPKGATNGDMIKAMFPKIEIYTDVINEIVDVEICEDSSELRCSIGWWNAPYKRGDSDGQY